PAFGFKPIHVSCSNLVLPAIGLTAFSPMSGMFPKKFRFPRISCLKFTRSGSSFATVAAAGCFVAAGLTGVFLLLDVAMFFYILLGQGRRRCQDPCHPRGVDCVRRALVPSARRLAANACCPQTVMDGSLDLLEARQQ